jgi:membrane associated rhomboid family serine protease
MPPRQGRAGPLTMPRTRRTLGYMANILRRPLRYRYYNATIVLIVVNILFFLAQYLDRQGLLAYLYLIPNYTLSGMWWQVLSYMFIHSGWAHIFWNMLALFMFGIQLEQRMGSTEFLLFYFICGIGAGIATALINSATGQGGIPVVGASGAIFAVELAFAAFFPDARVMIFGIIPMRAPIMVLVFAGVEIISQLTNIRTGVAHLTHLSGLAFAYLYLVVRYGVNPLALFFKRR